MSTKSTFYFILVIEQIGSLILLGKLAYNEKYQSCGPAQFHRLCSMLHAWYLSEAILMCNSIQLLIKFEEAGFPTRHQAFLNFSRHSSSFLKTIRDMDLSRTFSRLEGKPIPHFDRSIFDISVLDWKHNLDGVQLFTVFTKQQ